ncbi:DNA-binding protein D-ETS-4 isoform X1 [Lucilia cuprina]|uniref:DNA-binding protein D-ETS-4 isoform X1 n=2 Tax=Lucilia cuprina TaxID=7375 RepID=UPI001F05573A|nr:DNA-binding protein D-ETS-4 isoform X1 [Lucilia cuprina]XP_046804717.1 DNA-binding protein D-ETS-4 isoform X1 [Lucilia cuprina]XP_046804718.1 DNA-binding protein D-ETS-4 isoform X1 [Lucilia cuprina]
MENCNKEKMFSFSTTTSTTTLATSSEAATTATPAAPPPSQLTKTVANALKMPQTGDCLVTLPPQIPEISYEFSQTHQSTQFAVTTTSASGTINDPYATYTDNFDLSLLPQDYNHNNNNSTQTTTITTNITQTNLIDNIPTTVYNFDTTTTNQQHIQQDKANSLAVPDIKIEQTWSSCPSLNTIKQEQIYQSYFPLNTKQNQLVPPPPAYPVQIYPSPQSSPAQSEYNFSQTQYSSSPSSACFESLSSSRNSLYNIASSPCPSIDAQTIKQEQLHILPPSPPESNCDTPTPQSSYSSCSSGFDFKSEPFDSDVETFNDLNKSQCSATVAAVSSADHQLLREYLEDTTFQKRHNLKPLALESFIGGLEEVRDNIEPVISLALEQAKRDADDTCAKLQISQDPSAWSANQVHAWLRSTLQQFELPIIDDIENKFLENGAELLQLTENEFVKRIPEGGSTLHAQLELWKLTCSPEYPKSTTINQMQQTHNMWTSNILLAYNNSMEEDTEDEDDFLTNNNTTTNNSLTNAHQQINGHFNTNEEVINTNSNGINNNSSNNTNNNISDNNNNNTNNTTNEINTITPVKRAGTRNGGSHIHLWQFLKELLAAPHINGTAIRWIDRSKGIFKIEDSVRVAKLWGKRKNRPAMNYDKLSRSIRQYYKKGIMKKTERSQRLVYQFCQPYHM